MKSTATAPTLYSTYAAHTPSQAISAESLTLNQAIPQRMNTAAITGNRNLYVRAQPGDLKLLYAATVDLNHHFADPAQVAEIAIQNLPPDVIGYIYPSRYCQSDRLIKLANNEFGRLPQGYRRVQAIRDWVNNHVAFTPNSSNSKTSAVDTLVEQVGVCRDFAHLMIALCRALNIPARFTTGTDYGADPSLGPSDFHAYVEVYLGYRWYIFDPSNTGIPMGYVHWYRARCRRRGLCDHFRRSQNPCRSDSCGRHHRPGKWSGSPSPLSGSAIDRQRHGARGGQ